MLGPSGASGRALGPIAFRGHVSPWAFAACLASGRTPSSPEIRKSPSVARDSAGPLRGESPEPEACARPEACRGPAPRRLRSGRQRYSLVRRRRRNPCTGRVAGQAGRAEAWRESGWTCRRGCRARSAFVEGKGRERCKKHDRRRHCPMERRGKRALCSGSGGIGHVPNAGAVCRRSSNGYREHRLRPYCCAP